MEAKLRQNVAADNHIKVDFVRDFRRKHRLLDYKKAARGVPVTLEIGICLIIESEMRAPRISTRASANSRNPTHAVVSEAVGFRNGFRNASAVSPSIQQGG